MGIWYNRWGSQRVSLHMNLLTAAQCNTVILRNSVDLSVLWKVAASFPSSSIVEDFFRKCVLSWAGKWLKGLACKSNSWLQFWLVANSENCQTVLVTEHVGIWLMFFFRSASSLHPPVILCLISVSLLPAKLDWVRGSPGTDSLVILSMGAMMILLFCNAVRTRQLNEFSHSLASYSRLPTVHRHKLWVDWKIAFHVFILYILFYTFVLYNRLKCTNLTCKWVFHHPSLSPITHIKNRRKKWWK